MNQKKGFTLIELLIVIGILAILATAVVLYLNPAQILAESRDTQRMADLQSVISAISLTQNTDPTAKFCENVGDCGTGTPANVGPLTTAGTCNPFSGGDCAVIGGSTAVATTSRAVNGFGWIGFNFKGTQPNPNPSVSALPVDPVNAGCNVASPATGAPASGSSCYAFQYSSSGKTFELDTILESVKYAPKMGVDGGNNANFYELGTNVGL